MKLKKTTYLTLNEISLLQRLIKGCDFNSEISFLENEVNYFEAFNCFYFFYEADKLCAFASCFIPDEISCEVYFHIFDKASKDLENTINLFLSELRSELNTHGINDIYFLFDNITKAFPPLHKQLSFSYSECLMKYNTLYTYDYSDVILSVSKEIQENRLIIQTFSKDISIGHCEVDFSDNYAIIHHVTVNPNYQGLGYGTQTLKITVRALKEMELENIFLQVNSANTPAYSMYSHNGFVINEQINYFKLL